MLQMHNLSFYWETNGLSVNYFMLCATFYALGSSYQYKPLNDRKVLNLRFPRRRHRYPQCTGAVFLYFLFGSAAFVFFYFSQSVPVYYRAAACFPLECSVE